MNWRKLLGIETKIEVKPPEIPAFVQRTKNMGINIPVEAIIADAINILLDKIEELERASPSNDSPLVIALNSLRKKNKELRQQNERQYAIIGEKNKEIAAFTKKEEVEVKPVVKKGRPSKNK